MKSFFVLLAAVALGVLAATDLAEACACCTNPGECRVRQEKLLPQHPMVLRVRFDTKARLYTGAAGLEGIKGIVEPSEVYELEVTRRPDHFLFLFRDDKKKNGTLAVFLPRSYSIFEVDPRAEAGNAPPILYKEWKITSKVEVSGIFTPSAGGDQRITLIFQGRGNACTAPEDFTHWTLTMEGPKANYHFFGALEPPG